MRFLFLGGIWCEYSDEVRGFVGVCEREEKSLNMIDLLREYVWSSSARARMSVVEREGVFGRKA